MGMAAYKIEPYQSGWGVNHDGKTTGPTKQKKLPLKQLSQLRASQCEKGTKSISVHQAERPNARSLRATTSGFSKLSQWPSLRARPQ